VNIYAEEFDNKDKRRTGLDVCAQHLLIERGERRVNQVTVPVLTRERQIQCRYRTPEVQLTETWLCSRVILITTGNYLM